MVPQWRSPARHASGTTMKSLVLLFVAIAHTQCLAMHHHCLAVLLIPLPPPHDIQARHCCCCPSSISHNPVIATSSSESSSPIDRGARTRDCMRLHNNGEAPPRTPRTPGWRSGPCRMLAVAACC